MSEFELIRAHLTRIGPRRTDVTLGIGDDCAVLRVPVGWDLALSIDTLVAGVHFLPECDSHALGHKCLAVGLSDLAAMGADPAWATLALTLPKEDRDWLAGFAKGFGELASAHRVQLVGGDTTRGPLSVTVQVHGLVPEGGEVRRSGARAGDLIYVSGTLGDAALALRLLQAASPVPGVLRRRLERPTPRVGLGLAVRNIASAMIDISDGLAADLGHILEASGTGAEIWLAELPLTQPVAQRVAEDGDWSLPLICGDDYELCFTLPPRNREEFLTLSRGIDCAAKPVGRVTEGEGLRFLLEDGSAWRPRHLGYDHFADRD